MITIGWLAVIGIPLGVFAVAVFGPERIPKDRTVKGIRERIECEDTGRRKPDASREY
ncbi:hypothetical protein [Nocardia pneumoniae]|uniref:hypothetical protein n=1 Tax=Nocardia pneumoniae TaxID=228601 RepID=UPI000300B75E|nr:hypothetical protein [Nocardia pneumoniae]